MFYGRNCELIVFLWHVMGTRSFHLTERSPSPEAIKAYTCSNISDGVTNIVTPSPIHLSPYPHIGNIFDRHNG